MRYLILTLALVTLSAAWADCDPPVMSDQAIAADYKNIQRIVAESPTEQLNDYQLIQLNPATSGHFASVTEFVDYCRNFLTTSEAEYVELEHEYAAQCESSGSSSGGIGRNIGVSGTCYSGPGCSGSSTSASHGSIDCSIGDMSFMDAFGSCQSL